jgi:hypothetical protein
MTHPFALSIDDLACLELVDETQSIEGGYYKPIEKIPPSHGVITIKPTHGWISQFHLEAGNFPVVSTHVYPEHGGPIPVSQIHVEHGGAYLK